MMSKRTTMPRLKLDLGLTKIIFCFIFFNSSFVFAVSDELVDPQAQGLNLVEIEYAPIPSLSYQERKPDWGYTFGFQFRNYQPTGYVSSLDGAKYEQLFDQNVISIYGLRGGIRKSLGFTSMLAEASYATGSTTSNFSGAATSLQLTELGVHLGLMIDTIMTEPFVAPYLYLDFAVIDFEEGYSGNFASGGGNYTLGWTAGTLIQLNWLDKETAQKSLVQDGLNNTYIDLFIAQSQKSGGSEDLSTALNWGAGVKLEF